jgi:release factor glutamine methyltransferase
MDPATLMPLVQKSGQYLQGHGIANGRREAEWIFSAALGLTRLELYTRFDMPLAEDEVARLRALVMRRSRREPLAYVLGNQPFHGLTLRVGPGVLVPRPETEELVDHVLAALPDGPARVLDIGTGSGAIALALKRARPALEVEAVDLSEAALAFARDNAAAAGLEVRFRRADLAEGAVPPYAAVVANLPYIGEGERGDCDPELAHEPAEALFAGDDGLREITRLLADAPRLLAPGGLLWLEHGWKQGPAITALAAGRGLACAIIADLAGHGRFARIGRG